ncbi:MAG: DUF6164 family protein [Chromatiales bacterium]|nr:DUF6164 family protein [Chromatiales bacterium]
MPHLLFRLNGVPEDEEIEVRRLLDESGIDYYETSAGLFGISLAALWIRDDGEIERAHSLLQGYQQQRYQRAREDYQQRQREGETESQLQRALRQPIRTLIYLLIIAVVLYFSTIPFLMLGG